MAYTAFHTNSCTQIRGGSNTEILTKNARKCNQNHTPLIYNDMKGLIRIIQQTQL